MEVVYRAACGGLAFLTALGLTAGSRSANAARRAHRLKVGLVRLLRSLGATPVARFAGRSARMRTLADSWGRLSSGYLDMAMGREGGIGLAISLVAVCGLAGLVVSLSALGFVTGILAACVGIALRAETLRQSREREITSQMPAAFRSLASSLAAGRTLSQSMARLGEEGRGVISEAFSRAALRLTCGYSAQEALDELSQELDAPGTSLLTCALSVSHRTGSPLMDLFQQSATLLERQRDLERTLTVKTAQVRLSVRVVCLLPAILIAVLVLISSDYRAGLATRSGTGCVLVAVLLDVTALLVIRRLMRGVL